MNLNAPQIIWLALIVLGIGMAIERHGSPKTGNHNVVVTILASAISFGLLYWGGFFG